jgi:hypothetical protein
VSSLTLLELTSLVVLVIVSALLTRAEAGYEHLRV